MLQEKLKGHRSEVQLQDTQQTFEVWSEHFAKGMNRKFRRKVLEVAGSVALTVTDSCWHLRHVAAFCQFNELGKILSKYGTQRKQLVLSWTQVVKEFRQKAASNWDFSMTENLVWHLSVSPQLFYHHNRFTAFFPGPPRWDGASRELLDFMVQGEINRGRHTDHPAGRHSMRTKQCPPPPSPHWHSSESAADKGKGAVAYVCTVGSARAVAF